MEMGNKGDREQGRDRGGRATVKLDALFGSILYLMNFICTIGGTVCLPWTKLFCFVIPLKTAEWPKTNSRWCHDSNASLFVVD